MTWVTEWAPATVDLNACIDCGLCLPACPTFRLTGDEFESPRGRLAAMRAVDRGQIPVDERLVDVLDRCLQCRACETACPSLVPFGRLMEGGRAEAAAYAPRLPTVVDRLVFGRIVAVRPIVLVLSWVIGVAQRLGLLRRLPGAAGRASALRPLPVPVPVSVGREWLPAGEAVGTVALLSGCVMDPWFSGVHVAVIQTLRMAGYRVVAPRGQTCCGALAAHEGAANDAARMAERNVAAFSGFDAIVVDSAGCSAHMKAYGRWAGGGAELSTRIVDANEFVARLLDDGALPRIGGGNEPIAVQDPCHLRHGQGIVEAPRAILRAAGYAPVDVDPSGTCCGAAGAYQLAHPDVSAALGRQKAAQVAGTGATRVASPNPGCEMQLNAFVEPGIDVSHPIELYWAAIGDRRDPHTEARGHESRS